MRLPAVRISALVLAACVAAAACLAPASAGASPSPATAGASAPLPSPLPLPPVEGDLDAATRRALELEDEVEAARADRAALENRLAVIRGAVVAQQDAVRGAEAAVEQARTELTVRLVDMYKRGGYSAMEMLLGSRSIGEALAGLHMLTRVAELDRRALDLANGAVLDATYQHQLLERMKGEALVLRRLLEAREERLVEALEEQRGVVATLDAAARAVVERRQKAQVVSYKAWMDSSLPLSATVTQTVAEVDAYPGVTWKVAAHQPTRYHATGERFSAVCSWYGNQFHGRRTASGQVFNQEDLTCASKTLPFGTRLALTRGSKRVIVVVTDRGPFIPGRDLDLSRAAARALGFSGVERVEAEYVTPLR